MRGVIMSVKGDQAIVLLRGGNFRQIRNKNYSVGDKVNISSALPRIGAAAAAAAVFITGGVASNYIPASYVSVDINPSMILTLNIYDNVINVEPLNEDAEKVVEQTSLNGKNINETIEIIIDKSVEMGYISDGSGDVLTTVVPGIKTPDITDKKSDDNISIVVDKSDKHRLDEAKSMGVSIAKANAIEEYTEKFGGSVDENAGKLSGKTVREIKAEIKDVKEDKKISQPSTKSGSTKPQKEIASPLPSVSSPSPSAAPTPISALSPTASVPSQAPASALSKAASGTASSVRTSVSGTSAVSASRGNERQSSSDYFKASVLSTGIEGTVKAEETAPAKTPESVITQRTQENNLFAPVITAEPKPSAPRDDAGQKENAPEQKSAEIKPENIPIPEKTGTPASPAPEKNSSVNTSSPMSEKNGSANTASPIPEKNSGTERRGGTSPSVTEPQPSAAPANTHQPAAEPSPEKETPKSAETASPAKQTPEATVHSEPAKQPENTGAQPEQEKQPANTNAQSEPEKQSPQTSVQSKPEKQPANASTRSEPAVEKQQSAPNPAPANETTNIHKQSEPETRPTKTNNAPSDSNPSSRGSQPSEGSGAPSGGSSPSQGGAMR